MAGDTIDTIGAMPVEQLLLIAVAAFVGFWILRRAF
jgi:hypothetical protein